MKFEIMYNENTQLWKMEKLLTAAGYRKTNDCHWVQIYENCNGDTVVTQREDTSVCIADPVDRLTRYLDPQPEPTRTFDRTAAFIKARGDRSAWDKGVTVYALELLDNVKELAAYEGRVPASIAELKEYALNGAQNWEQYSYGGSALIYDRDIAERLCCPSELKRVKGGDRDPNPRETWLDTQARALHQAFVRLRDAWRFACAYEEA